MELNGLYDLTSWCEGKSDGSTVQDLADPNQGKKREGEGPLGQVASICKY